MSTLWGAVQFSSVCFCINVISNKRLFIQLHQRLRSNIPRPSFETNCFLESNDRGFGSRSVVTIWCDIFGEITKLLKKFLKFKNVSVVLTVFHLFGEGVGGVGSVGCVGIIGSVRNIGGG